MLVLLVGASGYLGSAIADNLRQHGHQVVSMVRSPRRPSVDGQLAIADLSDPAAAAAVTTADVGAVVHAGAPVGDWGLESRSVAAMLAALDEVDKPFVYISGLWVLGSSRSPGVLLPRVLDETAETRPLAVVAGRETLEQTVLTTRSARGIVVRPGVVHGRGGGIPAMMTRWARERGHGSYIGQGRGSGLTWPMVHVDDLADLVLLALTSAATGAVLHAVAEPAVPVTDIAAAADVAVGQPGRARVWPVAAAAAALGAPLAEALATSQQATAPASAALGWRPIREGVVRDLTSGSYLIEPEARASGLR
ncbi:MAG TPA: NAD-dependent epimerase/dehydratase family protein [Propionibacteriaceae bacterium]|nr:NAD-dependent epimerase/dehydratase family protein [Propionibacteriaceae bacterium]